jgi:hypothetical protein
MTEFSSSERKRLRELAGEVYEAEAAQILEELAASFARWRAGELPPSELLQSIHEFHRDQSRGLWSMYQSLGEIDIVARGLARGLLDESRVPKELRERMEALAVFFRK